MNKPRKRRHRRPLSISYDPIRDTLTVNGMTYSGDLFRTLAFPEPGRVYRPAQQIVRGERVIQLQDLSLSAYLTRAGCICPN